MDSSTGRFFVCRTGSARRSRDDADEQTDVHEAVSLTAESHLIEIGSLMSLHRRAPAARAREITRRARALSIGIMKPS